jgi:hypothetical protein
MNHILSLIALFVFILIAVPAALLLNMFDWIAERGERRRIGSFRYPWRIS